MVDVLLGRTAATTAPEWVAQYGVHEVSDMAGMDFADSLNTHASADATISAVEVEPSRLFIDALQVAVEDSGAYYTDPTPASGTETLRPTSDLFKSASGSIVYSSGTTGWNLVDESVLDTADYYVGTNDGLTAWYIIHGLPATALDASKRITSVTLKADTTASLGTGAGYHKVRDPQTGDLYSVGSYSPGGTQPETVVLTTRPWDGHAWTMDDLRHFQAGEGNDDPGGNSLKVHQFWVEVDWTAPKTVESVLAELGAGGPGASLTVSDEGTPLATDATTLDFVGAGVVASGAGATKTITISGASVADILDLPTAETDASLVLAPDGAGGVEFRAEVGGSMWFNVVAYGAVADSATDCTAAFIDADAAAAAVGGVVYIPGAAGTYYVSYGAERHCLAPSSGVTWQGDGMFQSVIELDPGSTVPAPGGTGALPFIEIGTPTAGATDITLRDFGILCHYSTKGSGTKVIQGIESLPDSDLQQHSDDITIERLRIVDVGVGVSSPRGTGSPAAYTAYRNQRWSIRGCQIETTAGKAVELAMTEDSEIVDCVIIGAQDGLQAIDYAARCRIAHNTVEYIDGGINLTGGCEDIDVDGNILTCIAGTQVGFEGGIVIRRESHTTGAPDMSRVIIRNNIVNDAIEDTGLRFASFTGNTGVETFVDFLITGNIFNAANVYLYDTEYPAKTDAVRLRVFDNYFAGAVLTSGSWSAPRTRFERNHVTSAFTNNADDWDFRNNVFEAGYSDASTGSTFDAVGATFATPAIVLGTAAAGGAASTVIRSDSTIVAFDATVPTTAAFSDAAATGSAAIAARRDHRHGMPVNPGGFGPILISDTPSTPLIFVDLLQNEAQDDLLYEDV